MRHVACQNEECANKGAPYFDFEPDEVIVVCPVCGKTMAVTSLEEIEKAAADKIAAAAADHEAAQATLALEPAAPQPPNALDVLATLPADRVVTVSDLLAILRPEPATEEKPDA